jgi:hypothetical protein
MDPIRPAGNHRDGVVRNAGADFTRLLAPYDRPVTPSKLEATGISSHSISETAAIPMLICKPLHRH